MAALRYPHFHLAKYYGLADVQLLATLQLSNPELEEYLTVYREKEFQSSEQVSMPGTAPMGKK